MNAPLTTVVPRSAAGEIRIRVLKELEREFRRWTPPAAA
jgi:hypothetical protein